MMPLDPVTDLINGIIMREGDFVDHPHDKGGPTRWGITQEVARDEGYLGDMHDLPQEIARSIYLKRYYYMPGFDRVAQRSGLLAAELTDTGVNMGPVVATQFLQRALNVFNRMQELWLDVAVDGQIGEATLASLDALLARRGMEGFETLLKALNCLQGARYVELAERREKNESFVYGWIKERVKL